jgi:hypothetical protein
VPNHPLLCPCNQIYRNLRHNLVRDQLFELLKKVDPLADIVKERAVEGPAEAPLKRCDIWYRRGATVLVIDVSVVEPGGVTGLDRHSDREEAVAARFQEGVKQRHYAGCPILAEGRGAELVPFVVEATGRMGPLARDFFDLVAKGQPLYGSLFLDKMSATLARATGRMICAARKSLSIWGGIVDSGQ